MRQGEQYGRGKTDTVLANLRKLFAGREKSQRAKIMFSGVKLVKKREKARLDKLQSSELLN